MQVRDHPGIGSFFIKCKQNFKTHRPETLQVRDLASPNCNENRKYQHCDGAPLINRWRGKSYVIALVENDFISI